MQNVWYHLRRPTLVRRIIIAQMLLLTLLWCLFLTFILWEDLRSPPILTGSHTYDTLFTLVERMDEHPQDRTAVLEAFSQALREGYGGGEDPVHDGLGNIKNIHVLFRQLFCYTGDDADTVSTNNSHNNFLHQVSSFPSLLATAAHVALPLL